MARARLRKLLADAGLASRRAAEAWIRAGRVAVNGSVARLGDSADLEADDVRVDGRRIEAEPHRYWMLHKPQNVLTTTADPFAEEAGRRTVLELLPPRPRGGRVVPTGRLDLDSEGLLLLTNDGALVQALLHPPHGVEREYRVDAWGEVSAASARQLAERIPVRYAFIRDHRNEFRVVSMCRVLRVHRSGYYAWMKEPESARQKDNQRLVGLIRGFHEASDCSYGSPRITRDLRETGEQCNEKRVARLMKQEGLKAKIGYKRPRYKAGRSALVVINRLEQQFDVPSPDYA